MFNFYSDKTQKDMTIILFGYALQFNALGYKDKPYKWNVSINFYKLTPYMGG